ncbi:uncharacterized protein LOC103707686 [Phoenix dactylifera]|uniref:Uncharacterized protein LOC103707686 n=1 Tax=Phoenix dactylifera TaxID=42345 RepID=A0A8B7C2T6_PHODC|nr:uncharacterized protein LOC103707686 [Phoenix dactylifera]
MRGDEARRLLGFSSNSRPTTSQVKAAYRRKAMESHPDLFPPHEKFQSEAKFKLISEAYSSLRAGSRSGSPMGATSVRVVRTGVPTGYRRSNPVLLKAPFLLIILGTVSLGGLNAMRAYQRQKEAYPSFNPFLP